MTTALLILLVLIELARLFLQYQQGKAYKKQIEKTCCIASDVSNIKSKVSEDELGYELDNWAFRGYEIVAATYCGFNKSDNKHYYTLFFTKKKIKNIMEKG